MAIIRSLRPHPTASLPPLHRSPFDRLIAAQAVVEDLPRPTADAALAHYGIPLVASS